MEARAVFHSVTNFIPKGFIKRACLKEVQWNFQAFFAETALITRCDSNFNKKIVCCQFSVQKFKLKYTQFRCIGTQKSQGVRLTPVYCVKVMRVAICQPFFLIFTREKVALSKKYFESQFTENSRGQQAFGVGFALFICVLDLRQHISRCGTAESELLSQTF